MPPQRNAGYWTTRKGHQEFIALFSNPDCRFEILNEALSFEWWKSNAKSMRTFKFPYRCKKCGYSGSGTTAANFLRTGRAKCMCASSNQISKFPTAEYHGIFLEALSKAPKCDAGALVNFEHWQTVVKRGDSVIELRCTECNGRSRNTHVKDFMRTSKFGCFCTGDYDVSSEEARQHVIRVVKENGFSPGKGVVDQEWWLQHIKTSHCKMEIFCNTCNISTWISIGQFLSRKSALCGCKWKTETLVATWLFDIVGSRFPMFEAVRQYTIEGCCSTQKLRFDVAVKDPISGKVIILVEIDGPQHFCNSFGASQFEQTLKNDLTKDRRCIENKIPLVRITQRSVWYNRFDWKPFLANKIEMAIRGKLEGVFVEPNRIEYVSGRYAEIRM